ncbi:unnamed protein product [Clonostachys solani]|uniref:FAD-binding FR-type domain-containing protein n=1 Tax=Clonostachys solani TaxID=160281 RepID=A0A9N9ZBJ4_9HYPO|nr:unnamed protein product [Clonostachys solani]
MSPIKIQLTESRNTKALSLRPFPGFPSVGHAIVIFLYCAINLIFCFVNLEFDKPSNFAARFGWMSMGNIALAVFFGLKNTPLALLSPLSYDGLNLLHRIVGYTAVAQMVFHGICYMKWEDMHQTWSKLLEPENWEGIAAGFAMLVLMMGCLRRFGYEVFYISHIIGCILTLVFVGLHRPYWVEKICIASLFAAFIWVIDRLIRAWRLVFNFADNRATLHALPNGGVKLISTKQLAWAAPGSHCFVWIPSIRPFETHPFTIVANTSSGLELIMKSHSGFTKAAYEYAVSKPGASVRVSFDGPYGSFPDLACYDRIVLIAGGSGATFTMGLACTILESLGPDSTQFVDFIWAVKTKENLAWFSEQLENLRSHASHVSLSLHVTTDNAQASSDENLSSILNPSPHTTTTSEITEKRHSEAGCPFETDEKPVPADRETQSNMRSANMMELNNMHGLKYEKLRAEAMIHESIQAAGRDSRVLIASCGPKSLMAAVSAAATQYMTPEGPSIDVHCESFGW